MSIVTFRTDPDTDRALAHLTSDGSATSEVIRAAIIAADRARLSAALQAESARLASDETDAEEMAKIRREMDDLRAW